MIDAKALLPLWLGNDPSVQELIVHLSEELGERGARVEVHGMLATSFARALAASLDEQQRAVEAVTAAWDGLAREYRARPDDELAHALRELPDQLVRRLTSLPKTRRLVDGLLHRARRRAAAGDPPEAHVHSDELDDLADELKRILRGWVPRRLRDDAAASVLETVVRPVLAGLEVGLSPMALVPAAGESEFEPERSVPRESMVVPKLASEPSRQPAAAPAAADPDRRALTDSMVVPKLAPVDPSEPAIPLEQRLERSRSAVARRFRLPFAPTPSMAPHHAEMLRDGAQKLTGWELDYSTTSLARLDVLVESFRLRGATVGQMAAVLFQAGCYLGEILLSEHGGRWVYARETGLRCDESRLEVLALELASGRIVSPIAAVHRRLRYGDEASLTEFVQRLAAAA